ncbi:hypothetical protein ACFL0L_00225 [Patescibacteria group bacterium]
MPPQRELRAAERLVAITITPESNQRIAPEPRRLTFDATSGGGTDG